MTHKHARPVEPASDDDVLAALGIKPELSRKMGAFGNFAISFSVICILAGGMSLFGFGLGHGGPAVMIGTWVVIGFFTLLVGLSLADVVSAYPTSGGPYFMAEKLGGAPWGWVTGWLNLLGLLGAIAGIDYGAAAFIGAFAQLQWDVTPTSGGTMLIFAAILVLHGLLNSAGVRLVNVLNSISVWWQLGGVAVIVGALTLAPAKHQSVSFVFTHFHNDTGFSSPFYVVLIGSLLAGYTFCGYDASAHVAEETTDAQNSVPRGIVRAIGWSWAAGFVLLAGLLFAIQDYAKTQNTETGVPPAQIFLDVLGASGAKALLLIVIVAMLFCGNAEVAAASRMVYAFSRSGALWGSKSWRRVNARRTPVRAVWFAVAVPYALAFPALWSPVAYGAITAINAVGMIPAYGIPVFLALRKGHAYQPGTWSLGRWRRPIGIIAVTYVVIITVVFCLPQSKPITVDSFNYAGVTLLVALLLAWGTWIAVGKRDYRLTTAHTAQPGEALLAEGGF
ncbi:amino acid permease [Streptomyces sp. NPDC005648]|uniref:amino acid permease n=1 Tax=Streptomyces sp. NPDC005648 TaxID=3157044 RepID=UPI0033B85B38